MVLGTIGGHSLSSLGNLFFNKYFIFSIRIKNISMLRIKWIYGVVTLGGM